MFAVVMLIVFLVGVIVGRLMTLREAERNGAGYEFHGAFIWKDNSTNPCNTCQQKQQTQKSYSTRR